jgi:cytochrome c-type biogenesis protein CcmH/NrfG
MFGFGKRTPATRDELLRRAEEFRSRKKPKKAVAALRKILEADPKDATAHGKLGPLLVQLGKKQEALESFRIAADDLDARGFSDKALSLWLQIAQARVSDLDAWEKVTQFHVSRGRKAEGVKVLLEAAGLQEKNRVGRPRAMRLLHDALMFEPKHGEAVLMLAPILVKEKQPGEARALLENSLEWARGRELKRMRWLLFFYFPGFKTFWRWLRA